jgi:HEAT repeat protein
MGWFGPPNIEKLKEKKDIPGLIKALDYVKDDSIVQAAVTALGESHDNSVIPPLLSLLHKKVSDLTKKKTVEALAESYRALDALYLTPDVLLPMVELLKIPFLRDSVPLTTILDKARNKDEVVEALVEIGQPAVAPLVSILSACTGDNKPSDPARCAIMALGKIADPGAVDALIRYLNNPASDLYARGSAMVALGRIDSDLALEAIIEMLGHEEEHLERTAAKILNSRGWEPNTDEMRAFYWTLLGRWDKCAEVGDAAIPYMIHALSHVSSERAKEIFELLTKIGPATLEPLLALYRDGKLDFAKKRDLLKTVARLGDRRGVDTLLEILRKWEKGESWFVANCLEEIGWEPESDELAAMYWAAKGKWKKCVEFGENAVEPLLNCIKEECSDDILQALASIGGPAVEKGLEEYLDSLGEEIKAAKKEAATEINKYDQSPSQRTRYEYYRDVLELVDSRPVKVANTLNAIRKAR